jgi:Ni,Fe-hydrogenase I cytochrome b subunit
MKEDTDKVRIKMYIVIDCMRLVMVSIQFRDSSVISLPEKSAMAACLVDMIYLRLLHYAVNLVHFVLIL